MPVADAARQRSGTGGASAWRRWLALILLVAALLRLIGLDKPLYVDEISTITVAAQPLDRMGAVMRQIDASPALYPLLLHGWMKVSRADAWMRLLPALCGILAVLASALVTRRAFGPRAGLAAAAVMAIAPAHIHYSQYVRSYSLFTLLVSVHVGVVMGWMDPSVRLTRRRALLLVLVTTALLYMHYLSALLFMAEGVYVIYLGRTAWPRALRGGLAMGLAGMLFLPGLPLLRHNVEYDSVRNFDRPRPASMARLLPDLAAELTVGQRALGFQDPRVRRVTLTGALLLFPLLVMAGVRSQAPRRRNAVVLLALVTLLPLVIYVGSGRRLIAVRFFVPFMLGYIALLGAGLASLRRGPAIAAGVLVATLCAVPLAHYYRHFHWSYDHRAVAAEIERRSQPGDALVVVQPYEAFFYDWYLRDRLPIIGMVFTALEDQGTYVIKPPPVRLEHARPRIEGAAAQHVRLWVIGQSRRSFASDAAEETRVLAWMDTAFERLADLDHLTGGDPAIRLYGRRTGGGRP
jgi:hypothetical protein